MEECCSDVIKMTQKSKQTFLLLVVPDLQD